MKSLKLFTSALCILAAGIMATSCTEQAAPSAVGEIITAEQLAELPADGSWSGRLVAVKGHPEFKSRMAVIKIGKANTFKIVSGENANILANIMVKDDSGDNSVQLSGTKPRNYIDMDSDLDLAKATYVTDDYQTASAQDMLFSGELTFEDGSYTLNNVTIHLPQ